MFTIRKMTKKQVRENCASNRLKRGFGASVWEHSVSLGGGLVLYYNTSEGACYIDNIRGFSFFYCFCAGKEDFINTAHEIINGIILDFDPTLYV